MISRSVYFVLVGMYKGGSKLKEFIASEIAEEIGISYGAANPTFQKAKRICIENGIWKFQKKRGNNDLYKIDMKKLSNYIRETEIFKETGKFIKLNRPFDYAY